MCDPISMGSFMLNAATNVLSFQAQEQQAEQQEAYRQQNAKNANKAYLEKASNTNRRTREELETATQKKFELNKETAEARGQAVASSENSGMTLNSLLADYERQKGGFFNSIDRNTLFQNEQARSEIRGFNAEAIDRANSVQPMSSPSPAAAMLGVAGAGMDAYSTYHIRKTKDVPTVS